MEINSPSSYPTPVGRFRNDIETLVGRSHLQNLRFVVAHIALSMDHFVVVYQSSCKPTTHIARQVSEGSGAELVPVRDDGFIDEDRWRSIFLARTVIFGLHDIDLSFPRAFRRCPEMMAKHFAVVLTSVSENRQSHKTLNYLFALAVKLNWICMGSWVVGIGQSIDERQAPEQDVGFCPSKSPQVSKVFGAVWHDGGHKLGEHIAACSDRLTARSQVGI